MADQDTKADVKDDEDDAEGHRLTSATPDEDAENRRRAERLTSAKPEDDDTEGHRLTS
ncbi:MAG TPA: hypothetical protein VIM76_09255 [Candidatus Dormibacteraeota bacterium]|jgi:hypothetical protein